MKEAPEAELEVDARATLKNDGSNPQATAPTVDDIQLPNFSKVAQLEHELLVSEFSEALYKAASARARLQRSPREVSQQHVRSAAEGMWSHKSTLETILNTVGGIATGGAISTAVTIGASQDTHVGWSFLAMGLFLVGGLCLGAMLFRR